MRYAWLFALISLLPFSPALAQRTPNWVEVGSQDNSHVFIDTSSIQLAQDAPLQTVIYRIRTFYSKPAVNGIVKSAATYVAYCNAVQQELTHLTAYDGNNQVIQSFTYDGQTTMTDFWHPRNPFHVEVITADNIGYGAFKYACSHSNIAAR